MDRRRSDGGAARDALLPVNGVRLGHVQRSDTAKRAMVLTDILRASVGRLLSLGGVRHDRVHVVMTGSTTINQTPGVLRAV